MMLRGYFLGGFGKGIILTPFRTVLSYPFLLQLILNSELFRIGSELNTVSCLDKLIKGSKVPISAFNGAVRTDFWTGNLARGG